MKSWRILILGAAGLAAVASAEAAGQVAWSSPTKRPMITSESQPWGSSFKFEVGVFKPGFTPTAANVTQWVTNWVPAQRTGYNLANSNFAGSVNVVNNTTPFTNGAKTYIWGFSGSELSGQWFLATNSAWKWPDAANNGFLDATTAAAGTAAVSGVGTINPDKNAPFHIQTAAITNAMPPATSWADWATENLGQIPPAGPSGDLNTNKITDVWEYALNTPTPGVTPNVGNWLQVADVDSHKYLELHIPRRRDHAATFTVEVTSDLQNGPWVSGPAYTEVMADTPAALVVRDKTPIGQGGDKRFMRVKVAVTP